MRQLDAQAATQEAALERVRALALDWTASPDIMQAAPVRLLLTLLLQDPDLAARIEARAHDL